MICRLPAAPRPRDSRSAVRSLDRSEHRLSSGNHGTRLHFRDGLHKIDQSRARLIPDDVDSTDELAVQAQTTFREAARVVRSPKPSWPVLDWSRLAERGPKPRIEPLSQETNYLSTNSPPRMRCASGSSSCCRIAHASGRVELPPPMCARHESAFDTLLQPALFTSQSNSTFDSSSPLATQPREDALYFDWTRGDRREFEEDRRVDHSGKLIHCHRQ